MPVVRSGPRGGKYILRKGSKVYLSRMSSDERKSLKPNKARKYIKSHFG